MKRLVMITTVVAAMCLHSTAQDLRKFENSEGYRLSVKEGVLSKLGSLKSTKQFSDTSGYTFHTHHNKGINVPFSSTTDASGNVYVTGTSSDFETTRGNYATIKVDTDGNFVWEQREPGTKYAAEIGMEIALDADNNPVSAGIIWNGHDMDLSVNKYNASNGQPIWQYIFSGEAEGMDVPSAISIADDGSIIVAGITYTGSNITWITLKISADGSLVWSDVLDNPLADSWIEPAAIALDNNGNIGITGYNGNAEYYACYYTRVYSPEGNTVWSHLYEDPGALNVNSIARSIASDESGNWYITGTFDTFSPKMRTLKYSPSGALVWNDLNVMTEEFSDGYSVLTTLDNKVYAGGRHFGSWIDDGWVLISFNTDGSREWTNLSNDLIDVRPVNMTLDAAGNPVISGWGSDPETWNNIIKGARYNANGTITGQFSYLQPSSQFGSFTEFLKIAMDASDNAFLTFTGFYTNLGSVYEVMKMPLSTGTMEWDYMYSNENSSRTELLTAWTDAMNNTYVTARYDSITDNYLLTTYIVVKYNPAGTVEWEKEFNEFNGNASNGIMARVTPSGDVVVYLVPNYGEPIKLKKYNTSGALLWEVEKSTINGAFSTFFLDQAGNILLGGSAFENASDPYGKFCVIRFSPAGEEQWTRFAVREGFADESFSLSSGMADAAGNTYFTGNAGTGGWFDQVADIVAIKYDATGKLQWVQSFPQEGFNTSGRYILADPSGDIFINGHREDRITFEQQMIVMRLDADGNSVWSEIYEDPGRRVMSYKLVRLSTGDLIVSGFSVVDGLNNRVILVKFDNSGNFINVTETEYDRFFYDMYLDDADNLYVLNQVAASPFPYRPYYSAGAMPLAGLFTLRADGTTEEELSYGPEMSDYYPSMLVPLQDGRLLIAGTLSNEFSMFQGLYFFEDEYVVSVSDIKTNGRKIAGQNMPNPSTGYTNIPIYLKNQTDLAIRIYDLTGRLTATPYEGTLPGGDHVVRVSTAGLRPGVYLYEVSAGDQKQSYRMMIK